MVPAAIESLILILLSSLGPARPESSARQQDSWRHMLGSCCNGILDSCASVFLKEQNKNGIHEEMMVPVAIEWLLRLNPVFLELARQQDSL